MRTLRGLLVVALTLGALAGCEKLDRLVRQLPVLRDLPQAPVTASPDGGDGSAQEVLLSKKPIPRVPTMVVLDASGSMKADDAPGIRFTAARRAVHSLVGVLPDGYKVGLLAYGTSTGSSDAEAEAGCQDITEPVPFGSLDRKQFNGAVDELEPSGYTPIGLSLQEAAKRLPTSGKRTIVLVSDGIDTCAEEDLGPDPCDVAKELAGDLTIHTVGFKLDDDEDARKQLACISAATRGLDLDASNSGQLRSRLVAVFSPAASSASLQPSGYRGLTPGMTIAQARKAAPKLGTIKKTGRVEIVYVDCTLVFNNGVLVQIETDSDDVPTLDGVRVGDDIKLADRLYRNTTRPPVVKRGYVTYPGDVDRGTGYRIYFDQEDTKLAGEITRIIVCVCMPKSRGIRVTDGADQISFVRTDRGGSTIYTTKPDGTGATKIRTKAEVSDLHASADGRVLGFTDYAWSGDDPDVYVVLRGGSGVRRLTTNESSASPHVSPDGKRIAYFTGRTSEWEGPEDLMVVGTDGKGRARLPVDADGGVLAWSADSKYLAYIAEPADDAKRLEVISPQGSGRRALLSDVVWFPESAWFPDGRSLLVSTGTEGSGSLWEYELQVVRTAGTDHRSVPARGSDIALSPDGATIAAYRPAESMIVTSKVDGSDARQLRKVSDFAENLSWSPSGKFISYEDGDDLLVSTKDGQLVRRFADAQDAVWTSR